MLIIPSGGCQWAWLADVLTGVVRLLSARWFLIGSKGTVLWSFQARHILADGPAYNYRNFQEFNHPPLMVLYAAHVWSWANGDLYVIVCMSGVFIGAVYWIFRIFLMFPVATLGMLAWTAPVHFTWTRFRSSWGSSV